jgi:hypothetical protein
MQLSQERIQEMKDLLEKEHGREFTWEEASDAAYRLSGLAELMFDMWKEECRRKVKLAENPNGFKLDGVGYTCAICGQGTHAGENWFDKWGIKCTICQDAINRKEIPASLAKNKESWYTKYDLESAFNLKSPALNKWVKEGVIKSRIVTRDGKGVHTEIFLIKDNEGFLPPKKMVKSQLVSEKHEDGSVWHRSEPWYRFVDPFEHLKGYKIMEHMRVIPPEEMQAREEEKKKKEEARQTRLKARRETKSKVRARKTK